MNKPTLHVVRSGSHPAAATHEWTQLECMEAQTVEFMRLQILAQFYQMMVGAALNHDAQATATLRVAYERALNDFIAALRNNRRIP